MNGAGRRWELLNLISQRITELLNLISQRITVNDRLRALGAFLKTKAFKWALVQTCVYPNNKKLKTRKSVRQVKFSQKSQNSIQISFQK